MDLDGDRVTERRTMTTMKEGFDRAATAAHRGKITFTQFAHETRAYWDLTAAHYVRAWPLPPWFTIDDVRQVMLEIAWKLLAKFKPNRHDSVGYFLRTYVRRNTVRAALKEMGASTHRPKPGQKIWRDFVSNPPSYADEDSNVDSFIESRPDTTPTPDLIIEEEERRQIRYDVVRRFCDGENEIVVVTAIQKFRGDLDLCARAIAGSSELREMCGIQNRKEAKRLIRSTMNRLVAEYGKQVA